jgi:hypothetical protein
LRSLITGASTRKHCSQSGSRRRAIAEDQDETGRQHTNTFYDILRVNWSIQQHYRETDKLPLQEYILLGGLCQGLNLGYSLESLRANEQSMGGIFWMYDDAWGENGWTIIDYYLRRKVSYYTVKRCLAPRRLVLRRGGQHRRQHHRKGQHARRSHSRSPSFGPTTGPSRSSTCGASRTRCTPCRSGGRPCSICAPGSAAINTGSTGLGISTFWILRNF